MSFEQLLPPTYRDDMINWIKDDCPTFDIGGFVLVTNWNFADGDYIDVSKSTNSKVVIAEVTGPCNRLLLAERTALNIISRASGIATSAFRAKNKAVEIGWHGWVAGTRKTTPGFKLVEKYSLLVGGCATHRMDLSQMTMLKDNHIASRGSITAAVRAARSCAGFSSKIEVECQSVEEAAEACMAGADIVMLDNFTSITIHEAARQIKDSHPNVLIEASGGIRLQNIQDFMGPNIDIISMGSLTHGYPVADFSFKIQRTKAAAEN